MRHRLVLPWRIRAPEVRLEGAIATLRAPYQFHHGTAFSHCGHDAFRRVRVEGRWVMTALTHPVRPTQPRAGPPAAEGR